MYKQDALELAEISNSCPKVSPEEERQLLRSFLHPNWNNPSNPLLGLPGQWQFADPDEEIGLTSL